MLNDDTSENLEHRKRVENELLALGAVPLGLRHFIVAYLADIIHQDEHIKATIYGRYNSGSNSSPFNILESALVATDSRVIFLNHHLGSTVMDEFTYNAVSGVSVSETLLYASVTLYTKVSKYNLSRLSRESAKRFANYIESQIETKNKGE